MAQQDAIFDTAYDEWRSEVCEWYTVVYTAKAAKKGNPLHVSYHVFCYNGPFHGHELLGPHGCHIYPPSSFLSPLHKSFGASLATLPIRHNTLLSVSGTKMHLLHLSFWPLVIFMFLNHTQVLYQLWNFFFNFLTCAEWFCMPRASIPL